jgi:uncharacterized membrane protein
MTIIAAAIFKESASRASWAFGQVSQLVESELFRLESATVAVRDVAGDVSLLESEDWTVGKSTRWGGFWGVLVGLAFAGPLLGLFAGLGLGRLFSRSGTKKTQRQFLEDLADKMAAGDSALFVAFEPHYRDEIVTQLTRLGGEVIMQELSAEEEAELAEALQKEEVEQAIKQMKRSARDQGMDYLAGASRTDRW